MTLIANVEGAIAGALIGAVAWVVFAFVGTPIRKFWDLRGEIAHALNKYARNIAEPPSNEFLLLAVTVLDFAKSRQEGAVEFRRLALLLISFWQNEAFARTVLRLIGIHGDAAGRMLLELAESAINAERLGPKRSEIAATLRLKP